MCVCVCVCVCVYKVSYSSLRLIFLRIFIFLMNITLKRIYVVKKILKRNTTFLQKIWPES